MAKFTQQLTGAGSGKLGGTILYRMFGVNMARSMPAPYDNPDTQKQRDQRFGVFRPCIMLAIMLKYWSSSFFITKPNDRSRYSEMIRQLFPAFGGTELAPTVDLTLATIGNGTIPIQDFLTCGKQTVSSITITWDPLLNNPAQLASDELYVIVTGEQLQSSFVIATGATRNTSNTTFDVPLEFSGLVVYVSTALWLSADGYTNSKVIVGNSYDKIDLA